jgi:hypothetical protein
LIAAVEWHFSHTQFALVITSYVIAIGAGITCITRTLAIAKQLNAQ